MTQQLIRTDYSTNQDRKTFRSRPVMQVKKVKSVTKTLLLLAALLISGFILNQQLNQSKIKQPITDQQHASASQEKESVVIELILPQADSES